MVAQLGPESQVHYGMQPPAQWPELIEYTQSLQNESLPPLLQAAKLIEEVDRLSGQELQETRYYGLGLAMCGIAKAIRDPRIRAEVIARDAKTVVANHAAYSIIRGHLPVQPSIRLGELRQQRRVSDAPDPVIDAAVSGMSPSDSFLLDALTITVSKRFQRMPHLPPHKRLPEPAVKYAPEILGTKLTARVLTSGLFGNAKILTREALQHIHETNARKLKTSPVHDPMIHEILPEEELRELDIVNIAGRSAAIRVDEFRDHRDEFIERIPDGTLSFNTKHAKQPPKAPGVDVQTDEMIPLHWARLGCPALYVSRLIPTVVRMVPEIIVESNRQLREQVDGKTPFTYSQI